MSAKNRWRNSLTISESLAPTVHFEKGSSLAELPGGGMSPSRNIWLIRGLTTPVFKVTVEAKLNGEWIELYDDDTDYDAARIAALLPFMATGLRVMRDGTIQLVSSGLYGYLLY